MVKTMSEELTKKLLEVYEKAKEKMGEEMKSWNKVFQFQIEGEEPFYIEFSSGEMKISKGTHPSPTATLIMEKTVLEQIVNGEMDAMAAFVRGKMRITGNVLETAHLRKMLEAGR